MCVTKIPFFKFTKLYYFNLMFNIKSMLNHWHLFKLWNLYMYLWLISALPLCITVGLGLSTRLAGLACTGLKLAATDLDGRYLDMVDLWTTLEIIWTRYFSFLLNSQIIINVTQFTDSMHEITSHILHFL